MDWLWFPYIPFGKLTIIQGNPGEGKTYFAMRLTAACTNRKPLPGMETLEPFNIIYQTAEDGLGDTVKPRLMEAEADLERVLVIDDRDTPLTLADERIARAIRENNARLVIIDPVQAFLGADVDMNRANEVRPIFRSLGDIAQATGCAIVLIGHLNKAAGTQSTYRGLGSIDITAAVRSLLFIGKLKDSPTTRVLIHEKSSLAPPGQSLAFSLGDEKGFEWIGAYDITADELLAGTDTAKTESKTAQAEALILELLADGKRMPSAEKEKETKGGGSPPPKNKKKPYRRQACDRERRHSMGLLSPRLTAGTRQAWQRRQGFYRYLSVAALPCSLIPTPPDDEQSPGIFDEYGGRLPVHVRCLLDEFANIGQIPKFEKLIATIRSREISASIILQSQSQLKAIYKDNADTIVGNCDTTLFLGGKEKTTLKEISEILGKETIDSFNTSETRGGSFRMG